jgi:hypothetical protein
MRRMPEIEEIVLDAVERLVAAGVSRVAAERAMREAEDVAVLDLIETEADRRLLDLFDEYGSAALAERKGLCQKTIANRRRDALERLARKKIGSAASDPLAA